MLFNPERPEVELLTAERANAPGTIGRDIDLVLRNLLPGSVRATSE